MKKFNIVKLLACVVVISVSFVVPTFGQTYFALKQDWQYSLTKNSGYILSTKIGEDGIYYLRMKPDSTYVFLEKIDLQGKFIWTYNSSKKDPLGLCKKFDLTEDGIVTLNQRGIEKISFDGNNVFKNMNFPYSGNDVTFQGTDPNYFSSGDPGNNYDFQNFFQIDAMYYFFGKCSASSYVKNIFYDIRCTPDNSNDVKNKGFLMSQIPSVVFMQDEKNKKSIHSSYLETGAIKINTLSLSDMTSSKYVTIQLSPALPNLQLVDVKKVNATFKYIIKSHNNWVFTDVQHTPYTASYVEYMPDVVNQMNIINKNLNPMSYIDVDQNIRFIALDDGYLLKLMNNTIEKKVNLLAKGQKVYNTPTITKFGDKLLVTLNDLENMEIQIKILNQNLDSIGQVEISNYASSFFARELISIDTTSFIISGITTPQKDDKYPLGTNYVPFISHWGLEKHIITDVHVPNISSVVIYPNPVENELYIKTTQACDICIYNIVGQTVLDRHIQKEEIIDVSGLNQGMYFLKTSTGIYKKIIKR